MPFLKPDKPKIIMPDRQIYVPEIYQDYTTKYIIDTPRCGAFLEMGLGKTVSTLTAIDLLYHRYFDVKKVLVLAPKLVARETWPAEIEKWDHLQRLTYSCVTGTEPQRIRALNKDALIYICNYDNLPWLTAALGGWWPFDMVVADESSRLKTHNSKRVKALKEKRPFIDRFVLLTGTPMGNGYLDLWSPMWFLDEGERLGINISTYRNNHFIRSYNGWGYTLRSEKEGERISAAISDICVSMRQKDYLSLPDRVERSYMLHMPDDLKATYKKFERERVMEMVESEDKITAVNAAVLTNKLLQFANGAVYDKDKQYHVVHDIKIEALAEIMESSTGHPVLVAYQFQSDKERILKALAAYDPVALDTKNENRAKETIAKWNRGQIPLMLAHPQSAGLGLNLQAGGHIIVFFGHTWSNELRKQFIARLERKGQHFSVVVTDLVISGTMDERVLRRQKEKESDEAFLMEQVAALIEEYAGTTAKGKRLIEPNIFD